MTSPAAWNKIESALDELIALPVAARGHAIAQIAGGDATLRAELESLVDYVDGGDELLDRGAVEAITVIPQPGLLAVGQVVDDFRVVSLLGRGGMGEVYKAERVGVDFQQTVALKVIRGDAIGSIERFQAERQILAQLNHPSIARLLDGGMTADGRPYMAMEFVDGHDLMHHCMAQSASLSERLELFVQVCDAVAYAHQRLVVHRDIKPQNIFVTQDGRIKLLDFGIAKLVAAEGIGDATYTAHLSPAYAAPEQLTGGAITTATDVYGLGATLYQLLCGVPPRDVAQLPFAAALHRILEARLTPPSQSPVSAEWPVAARQLRGDLDAISTMALRVEPDARYASARALSDDIARHQRNEPVRARQGARAYVMRRFIRRHWRAVGATTAIFILLMAGVIGISWQWVRAQQEAHRALQARNFLVSLFNASDPRNALDGAHGQMTARELLDAGSSRVEKEFANDPDVEIELLGDVAQIYRGLGDTARYQALQQRQTAIALSRSGTLNTVVIGSLLDRASDAIKDSNYAEALHLLDLDDVLIRRAGLDQTVWRARWWLGRGQALIADSSGAGARTEALARASKLFAALPTPEPGYVTALTELGNVYQAERDFPRAIARYSEAIHAAQSVTNRNDAELVTIWSNLAQAQWNDGNAVDAEGSYERAAQLSRQTYGEGDPSYWIVSASHARMLHLMGERERALTMFDSLMKLLPEPSQRNHDAAEVREDYGSCLAAEGRPQLAIPLLEAAREGLTAARGYAFELLRVSMTLGDAYDRVGRTADARRELQSVLDTRTAHDSPDFQPLLAARERWGRLLLDQGDISGAESQFREVLARSGSHRWVHVALAHADLSRIAVLRHDLAAARTSASLAVDTFDRVEGFRDVRTGPLLWRINAEVLMLSGDPVPARAWASKAVEADRRYDDPSSAELAAAEATFHKLEHAGKEARS